MMKRSDFTDLENARNSPTAPPKPNYLETELFHGPPDNNTASNDSSDLSKRFDSGTIIVTNPQSRFLGWDVLMSQVVKGAPTTVTVSSGYDISNSITVGTSASFTLIKDFLESSLSIDYSESWTSSQSQQFTAEVEAGKYGGFVSNPWTTRQSGHVFKGVIGSEGEWTYYQADSFESKSFDQMQWVDGVISLCTSDTFPVPRCLGEGTL